MSLVIGSSPMGLARCWFVLMNPVVGVGWLCHLVEFLPSCLHMTARSASCAEGHASFQ